MERPHSVIRYNKNMTMRVLERKRKNRPNNTGVLVGEPSVRSSGMELITLELEEEEEDRIWNQIAKRRDTKNARFVSHECAFAIKRL